MTRDPRPDVDLFDPLVRLEAEPNTPPMSRRGYPLPPWALECREATGEEVLAWLLELYAEGADGPAQAEAYVDAWLDRHAQAQRLASDRAVKLLDALDETARLRQAANELEELYVAASTPALAANVELDLDEDKWTVLRLNLAYVRELAPELDDEALARITEAAAVGAHDAYERERTASALIRTDAERRLALPRLLEANPDLGRC